MERRLDLVEQRLQTTNASVGDRSSIISSRTTNSDHTIRPGDSNISNTTLASNTSFQHAFEELLNKSWVYRRNQNREEDMSMRSSVLRLSAWSVLSDMSLANISIIAVISLPVQIQELSNGDWYNAQTQVVHSGRDQTVEQSIFKRPIEVADKVDAAKESSQQDATWEGTDIDQTSATNRAKFEQQLERWERESIEFQRQRELFDSEMRKQATIFKAWKEKEKKGRLASIAGSSVAHLPAQAGAGDVFDSVEPMGTYYCDKCGQVSSSHSAYVSSRTLTQPTIGA
jgi:hypothetical protein